MYFDTLHEKNIVVLACWKSRDGLVGWTDREDRRAGFVSGLIGTG